MSRGWIPRVAETMERYTELLGRMAGTLDECCGLCCRTCKVRSTTLELICGSGVFLQMITEPDRVQAALRVLASAQVEVARHLQRWTHDDPPGFCHQHAVALKGNILLRNDSCIMVSAKMYRDQIAPHDERVLQAMGGGGIHSCGDFAHLVDQYLALPSLRSLDFGQSEQNNVDGIYQRARSRKVSLVRVAVSEEELASGQAAERFPTGVVLIRRHDPHGRAGV